MGKNDDYRARLDDRFARFAQRVLERRLVVVIVCLIMVLGGASLSQKLRIDNSLEVYFQDDDPAYVYYQNFMEEYGNDEFLYIVYRARQGRFDLDALQRTEKLIEDLERIPYVKKVNTITNIQFIEGSEDGGLKIYSLIDEFPASQVEANILIQKLMDKPLYVNRYISEDANLAAILCEIEDRPKDDPNYHLKIGAGLKSVLCNPDYQDLEFWPVGEPVINHEYGEILEEDPQFLFMLSFITIFGLLLLFFRQVKGVFGPLFVVIFGLLSVLGFMGINDFPITALFAILPSLLIAIGVADAVHIISEYRSYLTAGYDNRRSIIEAVRMLGVPCLFTSATTAVGFASMTISPIRALRDYGWYTVFGVMAVFLFSFTVLLVILSFSGEKTERKFKSAEAKKGHGFIDWTLNQIAYINKTHYRSVLAIVAIISLVAVYGITKLHVNAAMLDMLGEKTQLYQNLKFVDKTMAGSGNFEIVLDSKRPDGVKKLQFVETLEKVQNFADAQGYLVNKTASIVALIKEVNRSLHDNDIAFHRLPSSNEAVSQFILLYEISGGEELEKLVSADFASARLNISVKSTDTKTSKRFYDDMVTFIESVKPADYTYRITGFSYMLLEMMRYITQTQIKSIMLALASVSIMMIIVFRSVKVGLISVLPNIFPILITLGFMGLAGI